METKRNIEQIILEELFFHQYRVGTMSYELAKLLGLKKEAIKIFQAGWMHDEGKRRIDVNLLIKPGDLSDEERRILGQHPLLTVQILKERSIDSDICEIALRHHENYDGTGYPSKLCGEEIPVGARIIRVCDVYDALISRREYRTTKMYTQRQALEIMNSMVAQFDKYVYDVFKENLFKIVKGDSFNEKNSSLVNNIWAIG